MLEEARKLYMPGALGLQQTISQMLGILPRITIKPRNEYQETKSLRRLSYNHKQYVKLFSSLGHPLI